MKCFLIANTSETVMNFRCHLIGQLKDRGHQVTVIAGDAERKRDIEALGVTFYCVEQDNRSLDPFAMLRYKKKISRLLREQQPDAVMTFQMKPNTFGVFAAHKAGVPKILSMVEGAGDVFTKQTLKWRMVRQAACLLYAAAFRHAHQVLFLNEDDRGEFCRRGLVRREQTAVIRGIGVDLERFCFKELQNDRVFLMVGRLHKEKGVLEYCRCAQAVKKRYPEARFLLLGAQMEITKEDLREYPQVEYLGSVADVRPYLEEASVVVLPSYREGLPMSLMEAEATGRAVITCDSIGCRDAVEDGYNGFLVPVRDVGALADKCMYFLENPQAVAQMGLNSRRFAEKHFDQRKINGQIMDLIEH